MISAPFELLKLPQFSRKLKINVPLYSHHESLFIGVSTSAINKISLRPPQVLSAHAVSPSFSVTAILASESSVIAYAGIDRSKKYLILLSDDSEEIIGTKPSKVIEVPDEIASLYLSSDNSQIAAVYKEKSTIKGFSAEDLSALWSIEEHHAGKLVYSTITNDLEGRSAETTFLTLTHTGSELTANTFSFDARGVHQLMSVPISGDQTSKASIAKSRFSYNGGFLYQTVGLCVYIYRVPDGVLVNSFEVEGTTNITGVVALPNNNIAISRDTNIELIDCSFQSLIHSIKLGGKGPIDMLCFSEAASVIVLMQSQSVLLGLPVTPTKGTLLESVGKCSAHKTREYAFADIFNGFATSTSPFEKIAGDQLAKAEQEYQLIIRSLKEAIERRDGPSFSEIVTYLKDPKLEWSNWHESGTASGPTEQDLVYEETDRNADRRLISKVCQMAFLPRFKPYLPIGVAVYLLTHPLFPTGERKFRNLLKSLENSDAILYRQALVSLPGLTAKDLVIGLLNANEATFLDAAIRLQEDFGSAQILQAIKDTFRKMRSISSLSILIERLSRHPETVGLMAPFIDAMGLLAWDPDHIRKLKAKLGNQIELVQSCYQADAAIVELFSTVGFNVSEAASLTLPELEQRVTREQKNMVSREDKPHLIPKYSVEALIL